VLPPPAPVVPLAVVAVDPVELSSPPHAFSAARAMKIEFAMFRTKADLVTVPPYRLFYGR
jgi:hypothetical protein